MALQGDLSSFALPDVLRLLAGTSKTGSLEVSAPPASGEVWLREGGIVGGVVSTSQHAVRPADVVLELLRLDGGSFVFDDTEDIEDADATNVNDALAEAEELLAEWHDVETVVPSMATWVSLSPALDADEITVRADDWRMLAAVAGGGSVRDLAEGLALTDLDASRQVKRLVEAGLTLVRTDLDGTPPDTGRRAPLAEPTPEVDETDVADPAAEAREADLAVLRSDDRSVVMVTADDALLPEPLPGEGVSYAGENLSLGTVDGRSFEAIEREARAEMGEPEVAYTHDLPDPVTGLEVEAPTGAMTDLHELDSTEVIHEAEAEAADPTAMADDDVDAAFDAVAARAEQDGDHLPDVLAIHDAPHAEVSEPVNPEPVRPVQEPMPVDDDRDSLLKFLSTVKP